MTDIDRLTLVVFSIGMLLLQKIPEQGNFKEWSFAHLTFDLIVSGVVILIGLYPVFVILGIWK